MNVNRTFVINLLLVVAGCLALLGCSALPLPEESGDSQATATVPLSPITPQHTAMLATPTNTPRPTAIIRPPTATVLQQPPTDTPPTWVAQASTDTDTWHVFAAPTFALAFKHPDPLFDPPIYERGGTQVMISVQARLEFIEPSAHYAFIDISIIKNPNHLPLSQFVKELENYGPMLELQDPPFGWENVVSYLLAAGAEQAGIYNGGAFRACARYGEWVYLFTPGFMTDSEAQTEFFNLLLSTLQFQ